MKKSSYEKVEEYKYEDEHDKKKYDYDYKKEDKHSSYEKKYEEKPSYGTSSNS